MEIKIKLNKPYTENQKLDFIVEQNHNKGYEIKETALALEAWGYTQEELEQQNLEQQKQLIIDKLAALDLKSIRAIRAGDQEYINQYEAEAQELRRQLQELG